MRRALFLAVLSGGALACGRVGFDGADGPDPTADGDGDGVPDANDVCPTVADDQHDEDADGAGDACDPCPHLADVGDARFADRDGDGAGDACDPAPDVAGQRVRELLTFAAPPAWTVTRRGADATEAWTYADDAAHAALLADHVAMLTIASPPADVELRVEMEVVVSAMSPDAGNPARNIAIIDDYDTVTDSGLMYGLVYDYGRGPPLQVSMLRVLNSSGNGAFATQDLGSDYRYGERYHLTYTRRGDTRELVMAASEGPATMSTTYPLAAGALGIRSRGLSLAVRYVVVIY